MIDIKLHIQNLAQWLKNEFDDMKEAGFSQPSADTKNTIKFYKLAKTEMQADGARFYLLTDGTKLKLTDTDCEIIK